MLKDPNARKYLVGTFMAAIILIIINAYTLILLIEGGALIGGMLTAYMCKGSLRQCMILGFIVFAVVAID